MKNIAMIYVLICVALGTFSNAAPIEVRKFGAAGDLGKVTCERCTAGDYLVSNEKIEIVIGGSHRRDESFYKFPTADALGSIVLFRPTGTNANGDIMVGTPYVRVDSTTRHVRYDNLDVQHSGNIVMFVATGKYNDGSGLRAQFDSRVTLESDSERVDIVLSVTNVGADTIRNFVYSLFFDPHQIYDFSPADTDGHREIQFRGYARENRLIGWVDQTPRELTTSDYSWGWDGGMILPDPLGVDLEPGESTTRQFALFTGNESHHVLKNVYRELDVPTQTADLEFESNSTEFFELVVRDSTSSAIFFRSFLDSPAPLAIELPAGNYTAHANFFPGNSQCSLTVSDHGPNRCQLQNPARGRARIRLVDSAGVSVPGKVSFHGRGSTGTPYFRPENPTYDDGYWESSKNSVFPVYAVKNVELPVGSYQVTASRGPEFSIDQQIVTITEGNTAELELRIDRVIDRDDLISMDSHLHTLESDGAVNVEEKLRAIVAEGIDVAISTDHNFPVDYGVAVEKLGLDGELMVIAGTEVTVPERLDYNTYPMEVRPNEHNHGAINALSTDLSGRFQASRDRDRGVILQINHPRSWQYDYFNWHELDPSSAAYANEGFDLSFDVLEVVNGADYDAAFNVLARKDWFNLLNRGYFFPLVGTSDSHEIDRDEPGYSRTYIYSENSASSRPKVEQLMQRVREGKSFASNGPILDLLVSDRYLPGDTLTATDGIVNIGIDVWTAPWMEASQVQIYVNGAPRAMPTRSIYHATATHLRSEVELQLDRDAYLIAEVRGSKDLFPVLQRRSGVNGELSGVLPYALTNPVFIDVDGNGIYDSPLPHKIEIRSVPYR